MRRSVLTISFAIAAFVLVACNTPEAVKPGTSPNSAASPAASPAVPASSPAAAPSVDPKATASSPSAKAATLEGAWPGAEGASLNVTKNGEKYKVEMKNADGKSETFEGTAAGDSIQFTRKGRLETIKPATAEETGMKWIQGEKNCVVITKGSEGYCRK
jgi:hypothetical protein